MQFRQSISPSGSTHSVFQPSVDVSDGDAVQASGPSWNLTRDESSVTTTAGPWSSINLRRQGCRTLGRGARDAAARRDQRLVDSGVASKVQRASRRERRFFKPYLRWCGVRKRSCFAKTVAIPLRGKRRARVNQTDPVLVHFEENKSMVIRHPAINRTYVTSIAKRLVASNRSPKQREIENSRTYGLRTTGTSCMRSLHVSNACPRKLKAWEALLQVGRDRREILLEVALKPRLFPRQVPCRFKAITSFIVPICATECVPQILKSRRRFNIEATGRLRHA